MTGGDYGAIFMADNMRITPGPPSLILSDAKMLANGAFQFRFTNTPGTACTVLAATDPATPLSNWTATGTATETTPGTYQFTDPNAFATARRYYCVSSP